MNSLKEIQAPHFFIIRKNPMNYLIGLRIAYLIIFFEKKRINEVMDKYFVLAILHK